MVDHPDPLVFDEPVRPLSCGDDVDVAGPAAERPHGTQRVPQFVTAAVTGRIERHSRPLAVRVLERLLEMPPASSGPRRRPRCRRCRSARPCAPDRNRPGMRSAPGTRTRRPSRPYDRNAGRIARDRGCRRVRVGPRFPCPRTSTRWPAAGRQPHCPRPLPGRSSTCVPVGPRRPCSVEERNRARTRAVLPVEQPSGSDQVSRQ